jgi:hypothetical protein
VMAPCQYLCELKVSCATHRFSITDLPLFETY